MGKQVWYFFKKNNLDLIWRNRVIGWCNSLPYRLYFVSFINKAFGAKVARKIHKTIFKIRFWVKKKPIMPTCEYVITTHCTMKCKNCNTFIPYFTKDTHYKTTAYEQFVADLDILCESVDYIDYFGFVGGEPMLNKDLDKMIEYACTKRQIRHIFLATSATILPKPQLLQVMKNQKVAVQLSDYRKVKFKNSTIVYFDKFKQMLLEHNIKFSCPQEDTEGEGFQSMPQLYQDKQDENKVVKMFDECWGQYANMLCDGILTQCPVSVFISRNLDLTNEVKQEIVNIREQKSIQTLTNQIINFYAKPHSAFCQYCHIDNIQYGLPTGEQV